MIGHHPASASYRDRMAGRFGWVCHGGSSKSSSSSSTVQETNQYDQRVAVESGGIGVGAGANVVFTDQGVVEGAGDILRDGLGALDKLARQVTGFAKETVESNNKILAEQAESDAKEIGQLALKGTVLLTLALFAAVVWMFGEKE
jgi:hypothetical protein